MTWPDCEDSRTAVSPDGQVTLTLTGRWMRVRQVSFYPAAATEGRNGHGLYRRDDGYSPHHESHCVVAGRTCDRHSSGRRRSRCPTGLSPAGHGGIPVDLQRRWRADDRGECHADPSRANPGRRGIHRRGCVASGHPSEDCWRTGARASVVVVQRIVPWVTCRPSLEIACRRPAAGSHAERWVAVVGVRGVVGRSRAAGHEGTLEVVLRTLAVVG